MGHNFSGQITEKYGAKYGNGNYILGHPKWKWELHFGTEGVFWVIVANNVWCRWNRNFLNGGVIGVWLNW